METPGFSDTETGPLVGGFNPSEKYEFVNWDDDILNWEMKVMFQSPPIRKDTETH